MKSMGCMYTMYTRTINPHAPTPVSGTQPPHSATAIHLAAAAHPPRPHLSTGPDTTQVAATHPTTHSPTHSPTHPSAPTWKVESASLTLELLPTRAPLLYASHCQNSAPRRGPPAARLSETVP